MATPPKKKKSRDSRDYIHNQCRETTTIEGPEFEALADPLANMTGTYCAECEDMFPIHEFFWADTKERISDYYERYQKQASGAQRFMASRSGMFSLAGLMLLVGLVLAIVIGKSSGVGVGVAVGSVVGLGGAIGAVIVHSTVIGPMILKQVCGVSDPRMLK